MVTLQLCTAGDFSHIMTKPLIFWTKPADAFCIILRALCQLQLRLALIGTPSMVICKFSRMCSYAVCHTKWGNNLLIIIDVYVYYGTPSKNKKTFLLALFHEITWQSCDHGAAKLALFAIIKCCFSHATKCILIIWWMITICTPRLRLNE